MCYSFFSNLVDVIQRVVTFLLACILSCAICFGLTVAIIAGIAYGYNYCLAEFITFTRQDVSVYMRRGQFYDKPPLTFRRSGSDEDSLFNRTGLEETRRAGNAEPPPPLSDVWMKSRDARKYAERLTKYAPPKVQEISPISRLEPPGIYRPPQPHHLTYSKDQRERLEDPSRHTPPRAIIPTLTWRRGNPESDFKPSKEFDSSVPNVNNADEISDTTIPQLKSIGFIGSNEKLKGLNSKIRQKPSFATHEKPETTTRDVIPEYLTEEIEEENVAFNKPV